MENSINYLKQSFTVQFNYNVYFTEHLFNAQNLSFQNFIHSQYEDTSRKILFVIDEGVVQHHSELIVDIKNYFSDESELSLIEEILIIPGGEQAKNDVKFFEQIINATLIASDMPDLHSS